MQRLFFYYSSSYVEITYFSDDIPLFVVESRNKIVKIHDSEFSLGGFIKGQPFTWIREEILNAGKSNHKIRGSFSVNQETTNIKSVNLFVLTDQQFAAWILMRATHPGSALSSLTGNSVTDPEYYIYSSKNSPIENKFTFPIAKENVLYFLFQTTSIFTGKKVKLEIWEEWNESILPIDVVTTTPPEDTSIDETIQKMILSAKKDLKIISPYIDMYLVKQLLEQHRKGIKISLITRSIAELKRKKSGTSNKENIQALTSLHKELNSDHRANIHIHSRIIIQDEIDALVSSADLTSESLKSMYNAGIILSNPVLVQKLLNYFNQAFRDSELMSV